MIPIAVVSLASHGYGSIKMVRPSALGCSQPSQSTPPRQSTGFDAACSIGCFFELKVNHPSGACSINAGSRPFDNFSPSHGRYIKSLNTCKPIGLSQWNIVHINFDVPNAIPGAYAGTANGNTGIT